MTDAPTGFDPPASRDRFPALPRHLRERPLARRVGLALFPILLLPLPLAAQVPQISVERIECFGTDQFGRIGAEVTNDVAGGRMRLYFRRLDESVEDFYWVPMEPDGPGRYVAVLPQPEDHEMRRHELDEDADAEPEQLESTYRWAAWWKAKELSDHRDPNGDLDRELIEERARVGKEQVRDWMLAVDDDDLEAWLEGLVNEPVEYYAALHDPHGAELGSSRMEIAPVLANCRTAAPSLVPAGGNPSLVVGETASWQKGELPFHWSCRGIDTRVDPRGVPAEDEECRGCIL